MPGTEAQLFRSFIDAMPYGVCMVDLQRKITHWNAAAEEITGYLGHEVLGRAYRGDLLIHCEGTNAGPEVQCPVLEVLRDGRAVAAGLFLRHKLGHRMPIHVLAFPLRDSMGEMKGVGDPGWGGSSEYRVSDGVASSDGWSCGRNGGVDRGSRERTHGSGGR